MCHAKFQTVLASLQTQTITVPVAQHSWVLNLFRSHFKAISASAPFLCSTPSMNHEPTIPCELFRDQFRNLCKATPLAIGAVAKPVCHRGSRVLCVTQPRQARSVLPHKNHWAKHSVFFPQHLQNKIQSKTWQRCTVESCIQWTSSSKQESALKMGCKANLWTPSEQSYVRYDKVNIYIF